MNYEPTGPPARRRVVPSVGISRRTAMGLGAAGIVGLAGAASVFDLLRKWQEAEGRRTSSEATPRPARAGLRGSGGAG
ncbi:MAG: hypothetical protein M5U12_08195 [Verrucomicrobia bacterium]|nr:hypothetical protein [Verrucomicrobiota bacterium]